mmetsp:Transcript_42263/g.110041  ORF Transcript_42263/g.110041 Transcript_42263/m.110041 type:complete len:272 (-) Transcript_42263:841-1656(-)
MSSKALELVSTSFALSVAGVITSSISRCSLAKTWAFFSLFSFLVSSAFACFILPFMVITDCCAREHFCEVFITSPRSASTEPSLASPSSVFGAAGPVALGNSATFCFTFPCSPASVLIPASIALSASAEKASKGAQARRKMAPEFPLVVTKPVLSPEGSLHSTRVMPFSSVREGPIASTTSPGFSLEVLVLFSISNASVTAMSLTHTYLGQKMALNSAALILPSPSASICLNMAAGRPSRKISSSFSKVSGIFSTYPAKSLAVASLPSRVS